MNPYRENTSEWHAFEQGLRLGRNQFAQTLATNAIFGKMGEQQKMALSSTYGKFDTDTGEFVRRNAVPMPVFVPAAMRSKPLLTFSPGTARAEIVTYLRKYGPTARKTLMKLHKGNAVERQLARLVKLKVIYRPKYGVYALHSDYLASTAGKKS